MILAKNKEKEY